MSVNDSGTKGLLSLTSVPQSEDGQNTIVCPHTNVTLTCRATQIITLTWADESGDIATLALNLLNTTLNRHPYILSLEAENATSNVLADFISTLEVMAGDIDSGTTITCRITSEEKQLVIYHKGKLSS